MQNSQLKSDENKNIKNKNIYRLQNHVFYTLISFLQKGNKKVNATKMLRVYIYCIFHQLSFGITSKMEEKLKKSLNKYFGYRLSQSR